jgi:peptidoglycan/LPS O-acetylase OafA/YrhL
MEKVNTENVTARTAARWGLIVAVLTIPVAVVVGHFFDPGRGRAAGLALALMIGAVRAFWYLRRHPWFWMSVAALVVIHVVLIILVPWSNKSFPAPALWPVAIADFAAVCGFFKLVERITRGGKSVTGTNP